MGDVVYFEDFRKRLFFYFVDTQGRGVVIDSETGNTIKYIGRDELLSLKSRNAIKGCHDIEGIKQYLVDLKQMNKRDTLRLTAGKGLL